MNSGGFLKVEPSELKFLFELGKESSCSMQLTNMTDRYVGFQVKTTNPKNYFVRGLAGILLPGSTRDITVTMLAQKKSPSNMQCYDMFVIRSVIAADGAKKEDITAEMFDKKHGRTVEKTYFRVVYIRANPSSPIPKESEEEPCLDLKLAYSAIQMEQKLTALEQKLTALEQKLTASAIQVEEMLKQRLEWMSSAFLSLIKKNATVNHLHSD